MSQVCAKRVFRLFDFVYLVYFIFNRRLRCSKAGDFTIAETSGEVIADRSDVAIYKFMILYLLLQF